MQLTVSKVDDEVPEEDARPTQRQNRDESDEEPEGGSEDDMDVDTQPGNSVDDQLAKKLVRYALSCEYSRTPIRRDGIKERGMAHSSSCDPHV